MKGEILPVRPIHRRKLSEEVAAQLQAMMLNNQLLPGQTLPSERELMALFNVGRSSVREALYALQRMGLVSIRNGEPACVTKPTAQALVNELSGAVAHILLDPRGAREMQQARTLYEILLVRYAATHASADDLARLKQALDRNEAALGDMEAFAKTDVEFHQLLAEIPGNSIFTSLQSALASWLTEQRHGSLRIKDAAQDAFQSHRRIYEAIAARDADAAERAMQRHLDNVGDFYWQARETDLAAS